MKDRELVGSCVQPYKWHVTLEWNDLNVNGDNTENLSPAIIHFFFFFFTTNSVYIVDTLHILNQMYVQ